MALVCWTKFRDHSSSSVASRGISGMQKSWFTSARQQSITKKTVQKSSLIPFFLVTSNASFYAMKFNFQGEDFER